MEGQKHVSPEEMEKIAKLRTAIGLDKEPPGSAARRFCTDQCLARYLRARAWDVHRAHLMLKETLAWRAQMKVDDITFESVRDEAETGKTYRLPPRDKRGRPVLTMRPGRENSTSHEGNVRHLIYHMETMARSVAAGWADQPLGGSAVLDSEQIVLFIDYTGYSLWNAPPMKTSKEILHILQGHYPERLGTALLFNAPRIFHAAYAVVKPFIDARTLSKIVFIDADVAHRELVRPELLKFFEQGEKGVGSLEESLGGDSKAEFEYEKYRAEMRAEDEEIRRRRGAFAKGEGPACP